MGLVKVKAMGTGDCSCCKEPEGFCPHKPWFEPGEIRLFCFTQVIWLIEHLELLQSGRWPHDLDAGSYIDPGVRVQPKGKAPFITPADFYLEIERRLTACGLDGYLVKAIYCWKETEETMAKYYRIPVQDVGFRVGLVLNYIRGPKFRGGRYRRYNAARFPK